jgi:glycosyltransferase involved in cell wall biosynthesis
MRFLHLVSSLDRKDGGPVEALLQIGSVHRDLGHSIEVACINAPGSPFLEGIPFPVHAFGPPITKFAYGSGLKRWLEQNRQRFDAVIVHGLWQYSSVVVRSALSGQVPYFIYSHGMLDPWFNEKFLFKHIRKFFAWHVFLRQSMDDATGIIFTTEEELERSSRSFFPFRWKAMVAPLGIAHPPEDAEAQTAAVHARFPRLRDRRFFLYLGRVHPKKGCDLLIDAFGEIASRHPEIDLVIAGPGDPTYIATLQKAAHRAGIEDRVLWTGMVSGPLKWGLLRCAEAFVLPSHQENFALAVVEAMAVNTPVLLSDKVQIWRAVTRSGAGMAGPDTREGVLRLLQQWLALDESERAKARTSGGECYRAYFTAEQASRALLFEITSRMRSRNAETARVIRELCDRSIL